MNTSASKQLIDETFEKNCARANRLYQFVMNYHDYIYSARDYGNGDSIKMVEVHTLTMIESNPGISVSELAQMWNRTKGTVSVNVSALEKKGYIYRRKENGNAKVVHLYPTPKGIELSTMHKAYDNMESARIQQELLRRYSTQELDTFYQILGTYLSLLDGHGSIAGEDTAN